MTGTSLAKQLDLDLATAGVHRGVVHAACRVAGERALASVTVWPAHIEVARAALDGATPRVRAAIGAPPATWSSALLLTGIDDAVRRGAHELLVAPDLDDTHGAPDVLLAQLGDLLTHLGSAPLRTARASVGVTLRLPATADLADGGPVAALVAGAAEHGWAVQLSCDDPQGTPGAEQVRAVRSQLHDDVRLLVQAGDATDPADVAALLVAGAVRVSTPSATTVAALVAPR